MKTYKFSEIAEIVGGATPSTSIEAYWNGDISWITPKDLSLQKSRWTAYGERSITKEGLDSCSAAILPPQAVLFSSRAPIGYVSITKNLLCTNQGFKSFVAKKNKLHFMYLYYLLKYKCAEIEGLGSGTTFKEVSGSVLRNYSVSIHEKLTYQKAIADVLSALDDKIELNNKINKNLEAQAEALFKHWFVDFEFPNENGEPYKSSGGEMKDSELGFIPKNWEVKHIKEIYNITIGRTPPRKESIWFSKSCVDTNWLSIADMASNNVFIDKTSEKLTKEAIEKFNVPFAKKDVVVLSFKLTLGRVAIMQRDSVTNEAIAHFNCEKKFMREYTFLVLKNYDYSKLGNTSSIATAINSTTIKEMKFILPNTKALVQFNEIAQEIFGNIQVLCQQNQKLSALRDYLLPKLMSGELRVNN